MVRLVAADEAARDALATALIGALARRGRAVSVLSRVAPDLELDRPGKDSHRHRAAGARDVAVISAARYAVIHEARPSEREPDLTFLLARMRPVDVVLALGFDAPEFDAVEVRDDALQLSSGHRFARDDLNGLAACLADAS